MSTYLQLVTIFVVISAIFFLLAIYWLENDHLVPMIASRTLSKGTLEICLKKGCQVTHAIAENEDVGQLWSGSNETTPPENYELEMERRFAERRRQMQVMCDKFGDTLQSSIKRTYEKSYYCPKYDLLVCVSRKGGSTAMKAFISNVEARKYKRRKVFVKHFFTFEEYAMRSQKPIRIVVIRHPFVRLVSNFRAKYFNGSSMGKIESLQDELKIFLRAKGLENEITTGFNFTIFLQLVIYQHRQTELLPNVHWQTATQFCSICTVDYDYIVQVKTYSEDMDYILKLFDERNERFPVVNKKGLTNDSFSEYMGYYEEVPADVVSTIYDIFKDDMVLSGYELTPYIRKALISQGREII